MKVTKTRKPTRKQKLTMLNKRILQSAMESIITSELSIVLHWAVSKSGCIVEC